MQKNAVNVILVGFLLLLTGCQTNNTHSPFNSPGSFFAPQEFTLTQAVQDALAGSGDPVLARVMVQSEGRVVLLRGYVKKIRQSDTAEQIARKVPGVENVDNQIIVRQ
jgi:hypothetical protein